MTIDIKIIEKEIGSTIEIEEIVPMMKMPKTMGNDFKKLMDYINENQTELSDAPYAKYVDINWENQMKKGFFSNFIEIFIKKWHFFCGIPCKENINSSENMISKKIEKAKYVQALHKGNYHEVGKTYKIMYNWIKENNIKVKGESYEFYTNDPREVKKEELETIVLIPIIRLI